MTNGFSMANAVAKLRSEHLVAYLVAQGWETSYRGQSRMITLELESEADGGTFQILLPASDTERNYRTTLQRVIYKLCGIEDREPEEIFNDVFKAFDAADQSSLDLQSAGESIKIRNSSMTPLRIRIDSRQSECELLPREALELSLQKSPSDISEFEFYGDLLVIHDD